MSRRNPRKPDARDVLERGDSAEIYTYLLKRGKRPLARMPRETLTALVWRAFAYADARMDNPRLLAHVLPLLDCPTQSEYVRRVVDMHSGVPAEHAVTERDYVGMFAYIHGKYCQRAFVHHFVHNEHVPTETFVQFLHQHQHVLDAEQRMLLMNAALGVPQKKVTCVDRAHPRTTMFDV